MVQTRSPIAPALLTIERAAEALQLGRSKVYELIRRGDIPSVQIDGSRRVRVRDLEAYVEGLGQKPAA